MRRALLVIVVACAAFGVLGAPAAYSAWSPGSSATGTSTSLTLGVPTSVGAAVINSSTIQVSWSPPSGTSPSPTQYVVRRTAPTTATVCTVGPSTAVCPDTGLTAATTYSYTVEALLGTNWSSGQSGTANATTSSAATLTVTIPGGSQTAGTAFNVTLTATTNGTTTDTAYTGSKTITFSGPSNAPSGTAPTYPATVTFASGVGTASITLRAAQTVSLGATDGTISGSASVTVVAGTATQLKYSSSTPSCSSGSVIVGNGGSFITKVTAYDAFLNPKTGAQSVSLTRAPASGSWSPTTLTITAGNSETTSSATFTIPTGNPPDTVVTASASGLTSATCTVKKN